MQPSLEDRADKTCFVNAHKILPVYFSTLNSKSKEQITVCRRQTVISPLDIIGHLAYNIF